MPLFIDHHRGMEGLTAEAVAEGLSGFGPSSLPQIVTIS